LFDAPQACRARRAAPATRTPFVPTPSEGHGAQGESKAPRNARRDRSHAQRSEHGEDSPFDAAEHRGMILVRDEGASRCNSNLL
jgi:hypothetical protein